MVARGSTGSTAAGLVAGGAATGSKPAGPGSQMLERMRQSGRPITPRMEQMAEALDKMDTGDGEVATPLAVRGCCTQLAGTRVADFHRITGIQQISYCRLTDLH